MAKSNSDQRPMIASEVVQVTASQPCGSDVLQKSSQKQQRTRQAKQQRSKKRKTHVKDSNRMRADQSSSSTTATSGRVLVVLTSTSNSLQQQQRQHCKELERLSFSSQLDIESNYEPSENQLLFESPVVANGTCSTNAESRDMSFMLNGDRTPSKSLKETKIELANGTKEAKIIEIHHNHHLSERQQQQQNRLHPHPKHHRRQANIQRDKAIQSSGSSSSGGGSKEKTTRRSRRESSSSWKEVNEELEDVGSGQEIVGVLGSPDWTHSRRSSCKHNNTCSKQQQERTTGKQKLESTELQYRSEQQQQRQAPIAEGASIREIKADAPTTVLNAENRSKVERTIATYLRQGFCGKNLTWQTNLVGQPPTNSSQTDQEESEDSDVTNYDTIGLFGDGGEAKSNINAERQVKKSITVVASKRRSKGRARSLSSSDCQASTESDTIALVTSNNTKQVLNCATAAITANFSPKFSGGENEVNAVVSYEVEKKIDQVTSQGANDSSNGTVEFEEKTSYKRSFFSYPSFSQQSATSRNMTTSGIASLSLSDAPDATSGASKVRLTTRRQPPSRQTSSSPHLSIDNLKMILERNLVATLIGVYILVSMTVIVLILPYLINVPREITISGSASEQGIEQGKSTSNTAYRRHHHKLSHTSSSLLTHDYEEFIEGFEDKSSQTDPADDDSLLPAPGAIVSLGESSVPINSSDGSSNISKSPSTSSSDTKVDAQVAVGNVETLIKSQIAVPKKKVNSSQQQQSQQAKISGNNSPLQVKLTNPYLVVGQPSSLLELPSKLEILSRRNDSTDYDNDRPRQPVAVVVIPDANAKPAIATTTIKQQDVKRQGTIWLTGGQKMNSSSTGATAAVTVNQERFHHHQLQGNHSVSSFSETSQGARKERSKFHDLWSVAHNRQCQPMKVPFCSKSLETMFNGFGPVGQSARSSLVNVQSVSQLAYDKTLLPNQFTQIRQSQAERALQRYEPIIDIKCYALMPLFLCSIYAPKCIQINQTQVEKLHRADQQQLLQQLTISSGWPAPIDDLDARGPSSRPVDLVPNRPSMNIQSISVSSQQQQQQQKHGKFSSWARLVPPCRSMCKEAFRKCMFFFEVLSLKLLDPEDCESLPESSDPNVCVGQLEHKLLQRSTESQNCQEDKFRCTDGECIPKKWRCDGFADCIDRSDEDKCSKCNGSTQFYCGQDICINKEAVCNGIRDCRDGRDERQCLRLSHVSGFSTSLPKRFENQRQLEVWSAVKESWVPVCGAHWSAMPMSHEGCQALGYSRANETLILFGPAQHKIESHFGLQQPRQTQINPRDSIKASGRTLDSQSPPSATPTTGSSMSDSGEARKSNTSSRVVSAEESELSSKLSVQQHEAPRKQRASSRTFGPGGWFDLSFSGPVGDYSSTGTSSSDDDNHQLVGIVEDMDSSASGVRLSRAGRADHPVIYERQFSGTGTGTKSANSSASRQAELIAIDAGESKWKFLTSMLYHGPQTGCLDKPDHLVSTVNLQCENFQCGRSITSYSTRVKQLQQQQLVGAVQQQATVAIERPLSRRASGSDLVLTNTEEESPPVDTVSHQGDDGVGLQQQQLNGNPGKSRVRKLEAEEEFDPLEIDEDYEQQQQQQQQQPGEASEPTDMFKRRVQSSRGNVGSSFSDNADDDSYDDGDDDNYDDENDDVDDDNDDQDEKNRHQQTNNDNELLLIDKVAREQPKLLETVVNSRLVVGGTESMPGEFPYLAALHGGPDEVFFCGGVLISINWLLTASHCVGNRTQPDGWMVKVGVTRRIASPAFVKKLKLRKIIKHPNFNHGSLFNNDIALILLDESVEFNQYLRPICLPRANLKLGPDNSKDCVVVGFGKSRFSQEANYLHVAHFVNVPIVRHSVCSNWYNEHGVNLTEGMLCAGYAEGKRDACQGDSGSGLFCRYSNTNQFFVAGVVSFGIKCATPKLPGVYTSVPTYVDWIESTTRQHGYPLT